MTIAAYGPSLMGGFVYEDFVRPIGITRALVRWSHDAVVMVAGAEAMPQRIAALGWHLLNGVLLWMVARAVVTEAAATFAAGLFLVHPVNTESVAYLASRPELFAATWLLGAWAAATSGRIWLAGMCAALAITGKELGVMTWLLVPLWAWQTDQPWSRRQIAGWTLCAAVMTVAFDLALASRNWLHAPSLAYVGGQLAQLGRTVLLFGEALLNPQALTIDHDWSWITRGTAHAAAGGWLLALIVSRGWWRFALLVTLVACLPRLLVPLPDGIHERHLYSSFMAWSIAVGNFLFPSNRRGYGAFDRPAKPKAVDNHSGQYAETISPLGGSHRDATKRQMPITAHVVGLLFRRCPAAVIRRIRTVWIKAIQRVSSRWLWPHIAVEVSEGLKPSLAHVNPATAVIFPTTLAWVRATSLRGVVADVFAASRSTVRSRGCNETLTKKAAARHDAATGYIADLLHRGRSAFAFAEHSPVWIAPIRRGASNREASETLACAVDVSGHKHLNFTTIMEKF